jgi:sec-independent protein translocase protein TatA
MNVMLAMLNGWEILLILAAILILFGAKKLPELARGLGQGIREFKKSTREVQEELESAIDLDAPPPPPAPPSAPKKLPSETQARSSEPVAHSATESRD